jgi:serine/threonine protein kinase
MDLEKGNKGSYCSFQHDEPLPFEGKGILGSGGTGQVNQMLSLISFREYARKRVPQNAIFSGQRTEDVKRFIAKIEVLKHLKHQHMVEFIGGYTDPKYIGLIMSPVAEIDLSTYLARVELARHIELRTFFGCLTRAVKFLYGQNVRHKDIKLGNILAHDGNILFTDFGLAYDFTNAESGTTVSMVNGITPRYCAPEVANHEPQNGSSDIWSLGVVFLEITTVLKGRAVEYIYKFLSEHGSRRAYVRTNPVGFNDLVVELKKTGDLTDNVVLGWIQDMLIIQQDLRLTPGALIASITAAGRDESRHYCGICCRTPDGLIDDFDELEIT